MASPLVDQMQKLLSSPTKNKNLAIALILILSAISFGSLIYWNNTPDMQILFTNLLPEDAGEIVSKLKEKKIPFKIAHNGTAILIPKDQVYDMRLALASEGLPKGGGVGFEVFDRQHLITSDFIQKMNYQRALQGELSRTIKQIKAIEQVRVHIVTPKESLFINEQKKPTASVFIKTRLGSSLDPAQVEGIIHLVASSVEGLEPGNVTVVDTSGKILSKKNMPNSLANLTASQMEFQKSIEDNLKKKVQSILENVLGAQRVIAQVTAEIDFQQVEIAEEKFDPQSIIRSEQKIIERNLMSSGLKKPEEEKGLPQEKEKSLMGPKVGSETNASKMSNNQMPFNANSLERQNEIRNYEISKMNKHIKNPVGTLKRISVAVVVDGTYQEIVDNKGKKTKKYASRTPEEMKNLENIVKKAVGFNSERGDQLEIINMPFNLAANEEEEMKATPRESLWREYLPIAYKPLTSLILAALFIFFVVRPLMKKLSFSGREAVVSAELGPGPSLSSEPVPQPKQLDLRTQTIKLVKGDTDRAAGVVKAWLNEKGER